MPYFVQNCISLSRFQVGISAAASFVKAKHFHITSKQDIGLPCSCSSFKIIVSRKNISHLRFSYANDLPLIIATPHFLYNDCSWSYLFSPTSSLRSKIIYKCRARNEHELCKVCINIGRVQTSMSYSISIGGKTIQLLKPHLKRAMQCNAFVFKQR